ncbi:chromosome segregation protein SMC [bacterium]|nr:MAG: chromosome segregation protein SMC [bacterium]
MIIKKLELQGFKSFPDRTKIVFHPGITAIVGPNGTGKSNLVDAMLWVLGGHRQRTVRGDRTDDILFNGNAKRTPISMADVVLSLGGDDAEMSVSHRVFRSGESEYRMDGKSVRLKDIQDEMWKHSIGEPEYFVIEQGAIGTFVTSKPVEKRSLLEEAAGTAFYKDRKRQAQNKLELSEQNLTRLEDIITEVEKAKNSLQRQASAATRYRRLRERVRELTSVHFQRKLNHLEVSRQDIAALYNSCLEKELGVVSRIKNEERNLAQARKALWDLEKTLKEDQERVFSLKSQTARLESEIERETKRAEFFEESRMKAESGREELRREMLALELESIQARTALEEMSRELEGREKDVETAAALIGQTKERAAARVRELQSLRDERLLKFQELTEKRNDSVKVEKEIELILRQKEKLLAQASEQRSLLDAAGAGIARFESEIEARQKAKEERELSIASLRSGLSLAHAEIAEIQSRITAHKEKRDEAAYALQALRKVEEKERSAVSAEDVPGAFGLLADLVRTSAEDAPLVDVFWKEEAKARVVLPEEFLKVLRPGLRGTYLLVPGQVRSEVPPEVLGDADVTGLLKSRVRIDERFQDLLPRLDEAVIVRDTAAAIRLWIRFPRLNFITPAGDLLLASGLLKLGEKGEGLIALTQEIRGLAEKAARFESEIAPLAAALEERTAQRQALETSLEAERARHFQEERALQDRLGERKFSLLEKEKAQASADILAGELEVLLRDKQSMSLKMDSLKAGLTAADSEERSLNERIETARKELAEVREKDSADERRFFELKSGRDVLGEKMNGLRQQIHGLARRKEATETKIASLEKEIRTGETEKARLADFILGLSERAEGHESERLICEKTLEEKEADLRRVRKEQDELERKLQSLREEEEAAKDARVKSEIHKAEIDRDLVNLEETCWQDLKKTLVELRADMAAQAVLRAGAAAEERFEEAEEESALSEEEEGAEEARPATEEETAPKPRRLLKKLRPVLKLSDQEVEQELEEFRDAIQRFKAVNLMAEEEFLEQKKRFDFLIQQRQDLRESIDSTEAAIHKIDDESKTQFLKALEEVNANFRDVFGLLFKGGNAEVKLLEPDNPLEGGVEIVAQPPGKRLQNLALLSGGEKSLTSMAFMFALFRYRPSPFCFLDEVDAALDDVNLARFLDLMKAIKHQTQFFVITHNYKTMEVADYIYGTTMEEPNITKLYSVKLEKKEELKADL